MNETPKKKKSDHVRFEDTVWMSLEEFKNGKVSDWKGIKNMRIEQDFHLSTPSDCKRLKNEKMKNNLNEEDQELPRKIKNKEEFQKIQYKKVIDNLDLWSTQLKQNKRSEGQSTLLFVKEQVEIELKKNVGRKLNGGTAKVTETNTSFANPEIDQKIINSILKDSNQDESTSSEAKKANLDQQFFQQSNDLPPPTLNSLNSLGITYRTNSNNTIFTKPSQKSLSQSKSNTQIALMQSPLKHKQKEGNNSKTVSRYIVDSDNKIIIKTDAQLQAEQNNLIINKIFKNKLSKVLEKEQPANKNEYLDIVKDQTDLFQKATLSNFKTLHYLQNMSENTSNSSKKSRLGTIQFKKLYGELFEDKLISRNNQLKEEMEEAVIQLKCIDDKEKNMLKAYKKQSQNSKTLKDQLNHLRINLNENDKKKQAKLIELQKKSDEHDRNIRKLESASLLSKDKQTNLKSFGFQLYSPLENQNAYEDQIQHAKEQKEESLQEIQKQLSQLSKALIIFFLLKIICFVQITVQEKSNMQSQANFISGEYENAKEQKNSLREMLKLHYLEGLKQGSNDKNCKSLVWTIIKLFEIGEEVTFNIFPDYLDEKNIQFLLSYAKLEKEKMEREIKLKSLKEILSTNQQNMNDVYQQIKKPKTIHNFKESSVHTNSLSSTNTSSLASLFEPTKNSWITKPVFVADISKNSSCHLIFEKDNKYVQEEKNKQFMGLDKQDKKLQSIMTEEEQLRNLENQIEKLKENELERIHLICIKENIQYKSILLSLFGSIEGQKYCAELERRKVKVQQLIKQNKTFHFMTRINQQTSQKKDQQQLQSSDYFNKEQNNNSKNDQNQKRKVKPLHLSMSESTLEPLIKNQNLFGIHQKITQASHQSPQSSLQIDAFSYFFPSHKTSNASSPRGQVFQNASQKVTRTEPANKTENTDLSNKQIQQSSKTKTESNADSHEENTFCTFRRSTGVLSVASEDLKKSQNSNYYVNSGRYLIPRMQSTQFKESTIKYLPISHQMKSIQEGK